MVRREHRTNAFGNPLSEQPLEEFEVRSLLAKAIKFHQSGNLPQAVRIYEQVLTAIPDNADALNLRGLVHHQQGNNSLAITLMGRAIELAPSIALYHNNIAIVFRDLGKNKEAIDTLNKALEIDQNYLDAIVNLAELHDQQGDKKIAADVYQRAVQLAPHMAPLRLLLAKCLFEFGDKPGAISELRHAIKLQPKNINAYERLGALLRDNDQLDEGLNIIERALKLTSDNAKLWFNFGLIKQDLGEPQAAREAYEHAIELQPEFVEAYHNLASLLRALDRPQEAITTYSKALQINPSAQETRANRSLALLASGEFEMGWADYTARRSVADQHYRLTESSLPTDLTDKFILIYRDQGLGDEIFFMRFVPELKARGASVTYSGQSQLTPIFKRLDFIDTVLDENRDLVVDVPDFKYSAGDLPYLLGMKSDNDTPSSIELSILPSKAKEIDQLLPRLGPPPYIGLTWRAGIQKRNRLSKIVPQGPLAESLVSIDATFVSLQRNPYDGEIKMLGQNMGQPLHDLSDLNEDLELMLALLDRLNFYICVSNTNTHLRAGLGKRCHVLVPNPADYRWMHSGSESPWFPGSKIFRENHQDGWASALKDLSTEFAEIGESTETKPK